ncbi:MAG TPA: DUF2721 domain-containing protein [Anaeromyxobacteraceae bacterium]|nr:DUF2721 domain-containing protein [Anaeromyxobacteraceae bacterium]
MPPTQSTIADVAHVIQLSIAPVFLLTAVATTLGVLNTRLARIVDRARVLRERLSARPGPEQERSLRSELGVLARRRRLVNVAITGGVSAALLVCLLIAVAFVGSILRAKVWVLVAVLFVLAMLAVMWALVWFLREIFLAAGSTEIEDR